MTTADLTFDVERHEYRLPTGVRVPSVTEILRETGISFDYESLGNGPHHQALAYRRALGTAVHADCHAFDDDELKWSTVDPEVKPYVDAWALFRRTYEFTPLIRERRVFHPNYAYAGTMDGLFQRAHRRGHVLVDIKTGDPEASAARFQTAAYVCALRFEHPEYTLVDRMAVQLCPELVVPYRLWQYSQTEQSRDFRKFSAFLTTFHEQYVRRKTAA